MSTDDLRTAAWTAAALPVSHPDSVTLIRRYYAELIARYYGRPTDEAEISEVIAQEPSDDLVPPTGAFVVARIGRVPVGCLGLRVLDAGTAELTRMFVGPEARRQGVAAGLIAVVEDLARSTFGTRVIRLDTRTDLVEARALYARQGYHEIEPYNDSPYAGHWFEKTLA